MIEREWLPFETAQQVDDMAARKQALRTEVEGMSCDTPYEWKRTEKGVDIKQTLTPKEQWNLRSHAMFSIDRDMRRIELYKAGEIGESHEGE